MTTRPLVFLDTETTGLHADRRPWEIAWIRREPDGTETERLIQISDIDLSTAELKGLQVGRFHERYFRYVETEEWIGDVDVMREFLAAIAVEEATRGAIIVGAVPNFDTETLAAMFRRHQLCPAWHYQLVDIEPFAAGWLTGRRHVPESEAISEAQRNLEQRQVEYGFAMDRGNTEGIRIAEINLGDARGDRASEFAKAASSLVAPPWRSDDLSRACGVEPPAPEERHTALGDARWVKRWYDRIAGAAA